MGTFRTRGAVEVIYLAATWSERIISLPCTSGPPVSKGRYNDMLCFPASLETIVTVWESKGNVVTHALTSRRIALHLRTWLWALVPLLRCVTQFWLTKERCVQLLPEEQERKELMREMKLVSCLDELKPGSYSLIYNSFIHLVIQLTFIKYLLHDWNCTRCDDIKLN